MSPGASTLVEVEMRRQDNVAKLTAVIASLVLVAGCAAAVTPSPSSTPSPSVESSSTTSSSPVAPSAFSVTFDSARAAYADAGYVCSEPGGDNERVSFSVTHCIRHIDGADRGIILYGMADGMVGGVDIVGQGQFPVEWSEDEPLVLDALRPIVAPEGLDRTTETIRDRLSDASFDRPIDIGNGLQLRVDATSIYLWTPELASEIDALFASPPAS